MVGRILKTTPKDSLSPGPESCECGITAVIVLWYNAPQTLTKGDYLGGPNLITRSLTELPLADERRGHHRYSSKQ